LIFDQVALANSAAECIELGRRNFTSIHMTYQAAAVVVAAVAVAAAAAG